ncbi:hypothetical protein EVAR_14258_1 [Eumeta japonica]|uniref:Uncharacterized protein n=1 Tax=Eumeta variegata TaxID=151549 RepID=A0A4C1WC72_EUMVA|nr:hypothetical protein EVAR_14258_1 [Eumeta japonica]
MLVDEKRNETIYREKRRRGLLLKYRGLDSNKNTINAFESLRTKEAALGHVTSSPPNRIRPENKFSNNIKEVQYEKSPHPLRRFNNSFELDDQKKAEYIARSIQLQCSTLFHHMI